MRIRVAVLILTIATPVCAQTAGSASGSSSGAMATVNFSDPPPATTAASTTLKNRVITPPTVVAPGLAAAGVETCLGSASGGLSVMGGGVTFGSTKVDEGCTVRLLARQLFAFGFQKAALALMCQEDRVAVAMAQAGSPCPDPAAATRRTGRATSARALPFAGEDHMAPFAAEAPALADDMQVMPFTQEEDALFARETNMN
jgi:hypothetical protein